MNTFLLLGDSGCGKTTYLTRMKTGKFTKQFQPTHGFNEVIVNDTRIIEYGGGSKFDTIDLQSKLEEIDGVILMFDLTSCLSYQNLAYWKKQIGDKPYLVIGNKSDIADNRKITPQQIALDIKENSFEYYDLSAKTLSNQDKPFLGLQQQLTC
jgi:GTPase SAR1 family protein